MKPSKTMKLGIECVVNNAISKLREEIEATGDIDIDVLDAISAVDVEILQGLGRVMNIKYEDRFDCGERLQKELEE